MTRESQADEALQRLGIGIDLLNLLFLPQMVTAGQAKPSAWALLTSGSVLGRPEQLEAAWADLRVYSETLARLAAVSGADSDLVLDEEDAPTLLSWLQALDATRFLLTHSDSGSGPLAARARELRRCVEAFPTPERRKAALGEFRQRFEAQFR